MAFSFLRMAALVGAALLFVFSCTSPDDPASQPSRIEKQKQIEAFIEAARRGQSHKIILMLENGIMDRQTALDKGLMAALAEEHTDLAAFLLNRGADPKTKNGDSFTALMEAALLGDFHLVRQLVELGADPHAVDSEGRTPLMSAVAGGNLDAVDLILSHKPKVNARDKAGFTALMWAATGNHPEIVARLIEHGANVKRTGRNGYSALWLAVLR